MQYVDLRLIEADPVLTDPSKELLFKLHENPRLNLSCVFDDGPAVVFRQMVAGCVALPDRIEQTLCQQHDILRTPMGDGLDGDIYVVDLSILGQWARRRREEPRFVLDPAGGLVLWESIR